MTGPRCPAPPPSRPPWLDRLTSSLERAPETAFGIRPPHSSAGRHSAVLLLFGSGPGGGEDVVLTERAPTMRSHGGQIAFPGGRVDAHDQGPVAAALREAAEEIDLDPVGVEVITTLPEAYVPVSDSRVTPVLAWWPQPSPIRAHSPVEVARVARVPLSELIDPQNRFVVTHPNGYRGPGFEVCDLFIWGFTAKLLDAVLDLSGLDEGWDRTRTRELPARYAARRAPSLVGQARW
ncbi:NUDIX hydrolase [Gephyromycinifex aptenodytis]|uniref:NUDIX hydrolase n=1 Tax=Gephyromycinifex aptenodytis TaxID=2716227 RepID=UPI0014465941|nr:CoA pyrophosphatase [Gephyromycinifex aptenodytis]